MTKWRLLKKSYKKLRRQLDFEQEMRNNFASGNGLNLHKTKNVWPKSFKRKIWLATAAAACLACIVTYFLINKTEPNKLIITKIDTLNNKIKDTLQIVKTPIDITSTNSINIDSLYNLFYAKATIPQDYPIFLADAFEKYNNGNYLAFENIDINNLPQLRGDDEDKDKILLYATFYKGIIALEKNNAKQAINKFKQCLTLYINNDFWKQKINWYLALAFLKNNEMEKSKATLQLIKESTEYSSKTKSLLKLIK
jgi:hypothetical protein